jgi:membrane-bound ClpP family serine protease
MSGICLILGAVMTLFGLLFARNAFMAVSFWQGERVFSLSLLSVVLLLVGGRLLFSSVSESIKKVRARQQSKPVVRNMF